MPKRTFNYPMVVKWNTELLTYFLILILILVRYAL
jgi:hypothetical protein